MVCCVLVERLPPAVGSAASRWVAVAASIAATHSHATSATVGSAAAAVATHAHAAAVLRTLPATIGTDILHGRRAAATASSATATAATTEATRAFTSNALQEAWHLLVGLLQEVDQITNNTAVAAVEEGSRDTSVAGTASTTDTMDIVVNVGGKIVVDDMLNIRNIET